MMVTAPILATELNVESIPGCCRQNRLSNLLLARKIVKFLRCLATNGSGLTPVERQLVLVGGPATLRRNRVQCDDSIRGLMCELK
jgi:hypothetical protein